MSIWKMQDAKIQLSAIVQKALNSGPQFITLRKKPAVVIISQELYDQLNKKDK
jgi:antitoxin Phd